MGVGSQANGKIVKAVDRGIVLGRMGPGCGYITLMAGRLQAVLEQLASRVGTARRRLTWAYWHPTVVSVVRHATAAEASLSSPAGVARPAAGLRSRW